MSAGRVLATFASLGAAAIHFASVPDHYTEWWAAGVFFCAVGAFQAGWALAALRACGKVAMLSGLVVNAAVIATWGISRTAGVPFGPGAGVPEGVTRVGVTATAFEVAVCLVALWRLRGRPARGFASSFQAVALAGAAGAVVTGLTMPAVEGAMSHGHGHGEESAPHDHDEGNADEDEDREPGRTGSDPEETPSAGQSPTSEPAEDPAGEHGHDGAPHEH
ncbi:hypothetical protein [Streptomyces spirodelae]|uniref:Uncharacterized protein n=1 Tax=Streptomyces spirodelae TaxID=2812904 RepID=A0ABS3WTN8_9ACTN|nr:hypothetical protein [Streptomyces spirodelae]MBO8186484.1 hypothetical protein [Streptomyces spirodelae]